MTRAVATASVSMARSDVPVMEFDETNARVRRDHYELACETPSGGLAHSEVLRCYLKLLLVQA
jgi:hypothetical protein